MARSESEGAVSVEPITAGMVRSIQFRDAQELLEAVLRVVGAKALRDFVASQASGERLTTQQAADLLQVSRPSVIKLVEQGKIPHVRVGNRRYLDRLDVERYRAQMGGHVPEGFPADSAQVREARMRDLVRLSEEQGDFDPERLVALRAFER